MVLTDTHTHQYYEKNDEKRAEQMQRCLDKKVTRLFLPNVDLGSVPKVFQLTADYPGMCFPMLGLHPCSVKEGWEQELAHIKAAHAGNTIYAIGEIGLDLYWDKTTLSQQIIAFKQQIHWAKELDLPIVIHCRDAFDEVFAILQEENDEKLRGIFHCFTGNLGQAQKVIDLGFYLGIGGVVTYKNAGLDKVVAETGLEHIVLETDSPYLTPAPFRGKPNESAYLVYVAEKVADLHRVPIETVAEITTANSVEIFGV